MNIQTIKQTISRNIINTIQAVRTFNLNRNLQEELEELQTLETKERHNLANLKREYALYNAKNNGLKAIEQHASKLRNSAETEALLTEIKRLMDIISTQSEVLEKQSFLHSELSQIKKPVFIKSRHMFKTLKNYVTYKKELSAYEKQMRRTAQAEFNLQVVKTKNAIELTRDGSKQYKSEYLKEHPSYLEVGETFKRVYYLADIPAYLSPYVFFRLLTSPLPFTLSIFMQPSSSGELLKKARQRLSVLEMQQNERTKQGKTRDQQIDKHIEEVMSFIEELVHEAEKGVIYSLYLQLEGSDEKELASLSKQLQNIASSMDLTFNQYTFAQKKAFKNFLPFNIDSIGENRILQSTAASYLLPFVSKQLNDPHGIFMGLNAFNNSLVFIDPFTSRNNNINIFGVSGSGKSVTAKILMSRLHMRGTQILVIDPEGEYVNLAHSLGGEVIQFSRENGINPFYISSSQENDILDHISTLKTFFKFFIPQSHYDGSLLDEALIKLYDKGSPSFEHLLELLKDHPMSKDLGVLSTGSLRGVFNSTRNLELNNDIIVLDLHDLKKDEKREPAMYLITSLIWNLLNKKTDKKRMLFIDEAHKLLVDPEVAIFYRELVKQARKRKVGIVSITQDVEDFLKNEHGKAIITNSETKILLKQSFATLSDISTIYPMTDEEKQQLGHLDIGEVVLFREEEHIRLNIVVLPQEEQLVFTS